MTPEFENIMRLSPYALNKTDKTIDTSENHEKRIIKLEGSVLVNA